MRFPVPMWRLLVLLGIAVATLSFGCNDFDRTRVRAHLGDGRAQLLVGHDYELGFRHGQPQFGTYVKALEFSLSVEEIAASLKRADEWEASH